VALEPAPPHHDLDTIRCAKDPTVTLNSLPLARDEARRALWLPAGSVRRARRGGALAHVDLTSGQSLRTGAAQMLRLDAVGLTAAVAENVIPCGCQGETEPLARQKAISFAMLSTLSKHLN